MPMTFSLGRFSVLAAVLLAGSAVTFSASAVCKLDPADSTHIVNLQTFGHQVLSAGDKIGPTFQYYYADDLTSFKEVFCTGNMGSLRWVAGPTLVPDPVNPGLYKTNVEGVGIRIRPGVVAAPIPWTAPIVTIWKYQVPSPSFTVELVRTASTVGTGLIFLPDTVLARGYLDGDYPGKPFSELRLPSRVGIRNVTCEVARGNIAVDMGSVASSAFTGMGSVGPAKDFNITIQCVGADYSQVGISLDGISGSSDLPGVLSLRSSATTAKGVGIRIARLMGASEAAIAFRQKMTIGNSGQSGTLTLPLRARYIQTTTTPVTPGSANGSATYTIEYL